MSQTTSPTTVPAPTAGLGGGNPPANNSTFFNSTGTAAPPSGTSGSPLISQDQSAFSQYVLGQTAGYAVTIGNLPGVTGGSTPTTIGQALQDFMDMPPAQLQAVEMQVWDAGYYINGDGSPVSAQDIRFGVPGDPASWTAFARALAAASSSGTSLTNLLQTRANQGAGVNNALPSPVTGGGHTYTIDLSNPTTVKYVADQVFQAALGRNATDSEVQDVTSKLRSQETQQGLAQQQGAEQQSRAVYQAGVTQRNVSYESQTNPNLGGQIPSGPFTSAASWATALLQYMNLPVTTSNVAAISAWANATGKFNDGSFNPLGTERPEGGSKAGAGGVQQFQSWAQGLEGTASMLMNGKYQGLISALQNGNATDAVKSSGTVQQELKTWSNGQITSLSPDSQTTSAAAEATWYANASRQNTQQQQPGRLPMGMNRNNAQIVGADQIGQDQAVQNTLQAGATNPQVGAYLTAQAQAGQSQTISPADVQQGQQPPNPGDTYINPVTVYGVNPSTEQAQAYQEATTGPNRIAYAGNNYLNAYKAVLDMIHAGGPTG